MELMVLYALGIILYCGYLTVKDVIADLREDGLLKTAATPVERPVLFCPTSWSSGVDILSTGMNRQIQAEYLRAGHGQHILQMT